MDVEAGLHAAAARESVLQLSEWPLHRRRGVLRRRHLSLRLAAAALAQSGASVGRRDDRARGTGARDPARALAVRRDGGLRAGARAGLDRELAGRPRARRATRELSAAERALRRLASVAPAA